MSTLLTRPQREIQDPPIARLLFADTRMAWLWLLVRLYLGWQWLEAGWEKVSNPVPASPPERTDACTEKGRS